MQEKIEKIPSITPSEWEIMNVLYQEGSLASRDIFAALPKERGWTIRTVKTLLGRLVAKNALDYDQIGNSYLYRPVFVREDLLRKEVPDFVDHVLGGSLTPLLLHCVKNETLSETQYKKMLAIIGEQVPVSAGACPGRKR